MTIPAPWVEVVAPHDLARHETAWRALQARAAEPNVFADYAFLEPALRRLAPSRGVRALLIWRDRARGALIGALALQAPRAGLGLARVWRSEQAALGASAFEAEAVADALGALMTWLGSARPFHAGLVLPRVAPHGPIARAAREIATSASLRIAMLNPLRRASLILDDVERFEAGLDKKRQKEWNRLERRLAERGGLVPRVAADGESIEQFLDLEARGWKGARATALKQEPNRAAFAREMLAGLARAGRMRIHALELAGDPIAMGVELDAGGRAFFWKIAYDETLAGYSPGVLLTRALSRRLLAESRMNLIDSCAAPDHPMIDRLWPDRLEFTDIALASPAAAGRMFDASLAMERAAPKLRDFVKRTIFPLLGRKLS